MDNKTFLKEMVKHAQGNTSNPKREDLNQKKVQVKMFKKEETHESLFDSIDTNSLELYAEMMRDRYSFRYEDE